MINLTKTEHKHVLFLINKEFKNNGIGGGNWKVLSKLKRKITESK